MILTVATWNINSVRLRIDQVVAFLARWQPDVLCLQETKCPPGQFPSGPLADLGYKYIIENGQPSWHGVAVISRIPVSAHSVRDFCGKGDSRHVAVTLATTPPVTLHSLYVPAGGDEPDREINEKFDHKLRFLAELSEWFAGDCKGAEDHVLVLGDLNVAPLPEDVWSHKQLLSVVSHTPVETGALNHAMAAGNWCDVMRKHVPQPARLSTWWSYRAKDWEVSDRGRRLDHIWASTELANACTEMEIAQETRGWTKPSDHVPVIARFDLSMLE